MVRRARGAGLGAGVLAGWAELSKADGCRLTGWLAGCLAVVGKSGDGLQLKGLMRRWAAGLAIWQELVGGRVGDGLVFRVSGRRVGGVYWWTV